MNHKDASAGIFSAHVGRKLVFLGVLFLIGMMMLTSLPSEAQAVALNNKARKCVLTLEVTPGSSTTVSGGEINYNLVVTNTGNANCREAELMEYYSENENYVSSSIKPTIQNYYWWIGTLVPGQKYSLSLVTKNIPSGISNVSNIACVSSIVTSGDVCADNTIQITSAPTSVPNSTPNQTPTPIPATNEALTEGWIYPGNPACDAKKEYTDGREIDTLKPEYYQVQSNGTLRQLVASLDGCNAYSASNVADVKAHSTHQYATVSGHIDNVRILLSSASLQNSAIATLTDFAVTSGFTGIELDWEQFYSWRAEDYANFKKFTKDLASSLHAKGKKLMIDVPALTEDGAQFKYEDFNHLDYVAIMIYDYQYDYGVGEAVAPEYWIKNVIKYAKSKLPLEKIVAGIPAYGYHGTLGTYTMTIDTYDQSATYPGFANRKINSEGEETWVNGNTYYSAQPKSNLIRKKLLLESLGIKHISVWHLGGNNWF